MPYCDDFWHIDYRYTTEYSIACLFDSVCEIVN